jgi:hypothetical protein
MGGSASQAAGSGNPTVGRRIANTAIAVVDEFGANRQGRFADLGDIREPDLRGLAAEVKAHKVSKGRNALKTA